MRFIFLTLGIIALVFFGLSILPIKLPSISLPKDAQHNTIGEFPFVEVMDNGDFYEIEGDENLTTDNCNKIMMISCNKMFKQGTIRSADCYSSQVYFCDDLMEKQLRAQAAAGNFAAQWTIFMQENCGSWSCDGNVILMEEISQKFEEIKNDEWGDKMKWLGNEGKFEKGYMEYPKP